MNIILDNKEVTQLVPESLPMLIHGAEKSGASMYTIALAAQWFDQGSELVVLCGYPMAEETFITLVGKKADSAKFFTKEKIDKFMAEIKTADNPIIIIKNIELFNEELLIAVSEKKNLIISGDINKTPFKERILKKEFVTSVYFSDFPGLDLSKLEKYEGLVKSGDYEGITKLAS